MEGLWNFIERFNSYEWSLGQLLMIIIVCPTLVWSLVLCSKIVGYCCNAKLRAVKLRRMWRKLQDLEALLEGLRVAELVDGSLEQALVRKIGADAQKIGGELRTQVEGAICQRLVDEMVDRAFDELPTELDLKIRRIIEEMIRHVVMLPLAPGLSEAAELAVKKRFVQEVKRQASNSSLSAVSVTDAAAKFVDDHPEKPRIVPRAPLRTVGSIVRKPI